MSLFSKKNLVPGRRRRGDNDIPPPVANRPFRRNQTLTGSASPAIASSNELDAQLRSPRAHAHHLSKYRRHLFRRFIVAMVGALVVYILLNQIVASIRVVATDTAKLPENRAVLYQKAIDHYLGGRPAERFRPVLNQAQLTAQLQQTYPEVKSVSVQLGGQFGNAEADVTLRKPVARWVIDRRLEYVDDEGVVFDYTTYTWPKLEIVDLSGTAQVGVTVVTTHRFLGFVGQIVGDLQRHGYAVRQAEIPPLTLRQLTVRITGMSTRFKLTIDRSAGEQAEDIARIIGYFKRHKINPTDVDVRVRGKAFYR